MQNNNKTPESILVELVKYYHSTIENNMVKVWNSLTIEEKKAFGERYKINISHWFRIELFVKAQYEFLAR